MPQANPGKQDTCSKNIILLLGTRRPTWRQYVSNTQQKRTEDRFQTTGASHNFYMLKKFAHPCNSFL